jgi:Uma2 family endonuclease
MTAEALRRLPRDGQRYWLLAGELRAMAPANDDHGRDTIHLTVPFGYHVLHHRLGAVYAAETGFRLARDPDTVLGADMAFVRRERVRPFGRKEPTYFEGPPDLVVEVISPGDRPKEVEEKVATWLNHATLVVLMIGARRRRVMLYRPGPEPGTRTEQVLTDAEVLTIPDLFPGWTLPVAVLFAEEPEV